MFDFSMEIRKQARKSFEGAVVRSPDRYCPMIRGSSTARFNTHVRMDLTPQGFVASSIFDFFNSIGQKNSGGQKRREKARYSGSPALRRPSTNSPARH